MGLMMSCVAAQFLVIRSRISVTSSVANSGRFFFMRASYHFFPAKSSLGRDLQVVPGHKVVSVSSECLDERLLNRHKNAIIY